MICFTGFTGNNLCTAIEAIARSDDAEWDKIRDACPKKTYKQEDHRFINAFQLLTSQALSVELNLTSSCLSMILLNKAGEDDGAERCLQDMVDTYTGWKEHVESLGIDIKAMDGMMKKLKHPAVALFMEKYPDDMPDPNPEKVKEHREGHGGLFSNYQ